MKARPVHNIVSMHMKAFTIDDELKYSLPPQTPALVQIYIRVQVSLTTAISQHAEWPCKHADHMLASCTWDCTLTLPVSDVDDWGADD